MNFPPLENTISMRQLKLLKNAVSKVRKSNMLQSHTPSFKHTLALHQNGQVEDARLGYHELLRHEPENHVVMNALACVYQGLGQSRAALELYQKAAAFSQHTSLYKFNIAVALMDLDEDDKALTAWDNYISQVSNNPAAYQNRAWIYWYKKNMLQQACIDYQEALKYDAENISIYCELSQVLAMLDQQLEAESLIKIAVTFAYQQKNPDNHKLLAISFMSLAKTDDAIIQWNKYLTYFPNSSEGYSYRGLLLREKGDIEQSLHSYQLAIAYAPEDIKNYCELAEILYLQNKKSEMEILLEQVWLLAHTKNSRILFQRMAKTFGKVNLIEKAVSCWQKCIALEPRNKNFTNYCHEQIAFLYEHNSN